ncbi:MAG: hypothetical protein E6H01_09855 [Bacillati bacterium ANGP1]|uniref:Uncharacterized protein n=1 Tax=Candidatus Segetimicrobium genomatis TaxID=2569760 RepID=A0A537KX63_9BACT|nr:MAG: hypothetical protein E6H01_09855 [Terrabacteria group bacterium ANGP1]
MAGRPPAVLSRSCRRSPPCLPPPARTVRCLRPRGLPVPQRGGRARCGPAVEQRSPGLRRSRRCRPCRRC